jgi:hypothetical protein
LQWDPHVRLFIEPLELADEICKRTDHHLDALTDPKTMVTRGLNMNPLITATPKHRMLRPRAAYREITNGFRSEWRAALHAGMRSVVETARRRAIDAIRLILERLPIPSAA